jgi:hypothetical protein
MPGITRFTVTERRITVRYPNGHLTHSRPKHVQIPEALLGVYHVPEIDSYPTDYQGPLDTLEQWTAQAYGQD